MDFSKRFGRPQMSGHIIYFPPHLPPIGTRSLFTNRFRINLMRPTSQIKYFLFLFYFLYMVYRGKYSYIVTALAGLGFCFFNRSPTSNKSIYIHNNYVVLVCAVGLLRGKLFHGYRPCTWLPSHWTGWNGSAYTTAFGNIIIVIGKRITDNKNNTLLILLHGPLGMIRCLGLFTFSSFFGVCRRLIRSRS